VTPLSQGGQGAGTTDGRGGDEDHEETPINDMFAKNGKIREEAACSRHVPFEVKAPSESKARWTITSCWLPSPADQAFQPLSNRAVRWSKNKSSIKERAGASNTGTLVVFHPS